LSNSACEDGALGDFIDMSYKSGRTLLARAPAYPPAGSEIRLDLPVDLIVGDLAGASVISSLRLQHLFVADNAAMPQAYMATPAKDWGAVDTELVAVRLPYLLGVVY
jgi:hypothetical protein